MLSFLKRRGFLVVSGFVLFALFVWYAGPYFAFADFRPLETARARIVLIAIVVALWGLSRFLKRRRADRASDQLVAAVVKQSHAEKERPSAEAVQLRERFEEAVTTLKQKRRGGHSLYDLPWYVIIGAPGSGKTTALVNSGLKFPLESRTGKGALRGVGGTRNCDWWFTDEAVFLDTAGRYTTQDSDPTSDSAAWAEFLGLLRKYRKRRPLNGVILAMSSHDLMVESQAGREAHVGAARRRLTELNQELGIQIPVYLMVTKCDLVAGFTEYFDDLAQEGRAQVWGVTFPYEQTMKGEAARAFPAELDVLIARLNGRLFARLEEEREPRRRAKVFAFPQQVAALRDSLADFVSEVFGYTRFDRQVLLRGVYFTSGTQEGTPIDRLLGAIGRRFAVAPEAVVGPPGRGKAYFIERLLREVLLAESGLAGVNRRLEVQKAAAQLGSYAALVVAALAAVIAFSVSYSRNTTYLAEVADDVARLQSVPRVGPDASLEMAVPRLDAVRAVAESANRYRGDTPLAMRWGLFQGSSLGNAAQDAYVRELDGALLPRVATRFKERLVDYVPEPEKLYEYLKAYLMLGQPDRLDPTHLAFLAELEWKGSYAADPQTGASLSRHFQSLLTSDARLRPVVLDEALVEQARSTIRQASIPVLMYRQLRLNYSSDPTHQVKLDVLAGVGAAQVLRRKSGIPLSEPVPGIYTKPVFEEITGRGAAELVKQFASDTWVWGEGGLSPITGAARLASEMIDVYEKDYIAAWDAILEDLDVASFSGARTAEALAILAAPTSPLRGFLKAVADNTQLVKQQDAAQPASGVSDRLQGLFNRGREAIGLQTTAPGTEITRHFEPIHRLVAGDPGSAPIDGVLAKVGQLQQKLSSIGTGVGLRASDPATSAAVGEIAKSLNQDAAALPPAVGAVVTQVGLRAVSVATGGIRSTIESRYQQDVMRPCVAAIEGRYPFNPMSAVDVPLADFGRLFGHGGVFDTFFRTNLAEFVDTARNPWAWRADAAGAAVGGSTAILRQFQLAERIRDSFFRSGTQVPELRFSVTPAELDALATRFLLEIDGQSFDYRHGPERNWSAVWPGPNPGVAAATFEERSGGRPNIVHQGPWAWFRLVNAGHIQRESDVRHVITLQSGGHQARVKLEAASILNPYAMREWQQFRCSI
ncbi:MAG: type VI secretion system membrane subunit TssM [Vicinamibacterales bacterium]